MHVLCACVGETLQSHSPSPSVYTQNVYPMPSIACTNHGVILTLQTVVLLLHTQTIAVLVTPALCAAVAPHEAKVALAQVGLHARTVGLTALPTHRLATPLDAVIEETKNYVCILFATCCCHNHSVCAYT